MGCGTPQSYAGTMLGTSVFSEFSMMSMLKVTSWCMEVKFTINVTLLSGWMLKACCDTWDLIPDV